MTDLDTVLADAHQECDTLDRHGQRPAVEYLRALLFQVAESTRTYREFLSEPDARLASGMSVRWLRGEYARLEREGHARTDRGVRCYRHVCLPRRIDADDAREAGRRAATGDRKSA